MPNWLLCSICHLQHIKDGHYEFDFKLPDVYGVFTFRTLYERAGLSPLHTMTRVPVNHFCFLALRFFFSTFSLLQGSSVSSRWIWTFYCIGVSLLCFFLFGLAFFFFKKTTHLFFVLHRCLSVFLSLRLCFCTTKTRPARAVRRRRALVKSQSPVRSTARNVRRRQRRRAMRRQRKAVVAVAVLIRRKTTE